MPNAPSGQYSAAKVEYDQLGRVNRQSNPAEVNESWQVVGDDAANGWLWMSYEYDWKGRIVKTINTDGTFQTVSYEGCGCAGGEVVTTTDAGTVVDSVDKKRKSKIYSDILGRAYKSQLLNWDNTIYSTVMTKFNARNQVESVRTYQGEEPSNWETSCSTGTCQETYSTYDGHGRVVTAKKPSQTAPDSFTYFADDTVATRTDARGVVTSYLYNSRKLVTNVNYTVPQSSNIPATAPTGYTYDAVGNVTSMTDASGSMSYQYDQLSRLTSETKTFAGLSGTFALNYIYTFTGQLQSVNIPSNTSFNYSYDKIGRLSQVGSAGFEITVPVISSLKYRSWGAVKEMNYGNNMKTTLAYNTKQMPVSYQVTNFTNTTDAVGSTYEYYNDGMLRKVTNLTDNKFDRAYSYDQAGRLKEALTGDEARGGTTADGPYKQIYNYDIWGNNINYQHREWTGQTITDNTPYTNNRHPWFGYNSNGQAVSSTDGSHDYDAVSRPTTFISGASLTNGTTTLPAYESTTTYTGNGIPAKQKALQRQYDSGGNIVIFSDATTYYLRSSVLGGQTVAEITDQGIVRKNFIYASGMKIAECTRYTSPTIYWDTVWQHTDPVTGSHFETGQNGYYYPWLNRQLDPLGRDVTEPPDPLNYEEPSYLNPNRNIFWPVEYQWNDITLVGESMSQRDLAMSHWEGRLQNTWDTIAARDAARRGDLATVQLIMERNPNVGIEASGPGGSVTLWGREAAGFLVGLFDIVFGDNTQNNNDLSKNSRGKNNNSSNKSDSKDCQFHKANLLGNSDNKKALDEAWNRSQDGTENEGEEGGLLGDNNAFGQLGAGRGNVWVNKVYKPTIRYKTKLNGFASWAEKVIRNDLNDVVYFYSYHTHPSKEGYVNDHGEHVITNNPNEPSIDDKLVSKRLKLTGVIVTKTQIIVYDDSGVKCRFKK